MKSDGILSPIKIEKNLEILGSMYCMLLKYILYLFKNNFRSNGYANSLFLSIKSPNAQHYSTIIQGMTKYNQVILKIKSILIFLLLYLLHLSKTHKLCFTIHFSRIIINNKLKPILL